ncbi:MAG: MGMT family protein [Bacteroides sp.]|nr:MGMT family protein [Bacteroidales bacterium]MBD5283938.1 MGMT family protein [Bacteroides sp.]MBD5336931.1 MGMT family protein [Bacteroides sp.]
MKVDSIEFSRAVMEVVAAIPCGMVSTYGDVAALAGSPSHARLVGKILGAIGMDSDIPCHRVVNCQGRPAPHWLSQLALLRAEGIEVGASNRVDLRRYRWHPLPPE